MKKRSFLRYGLGLLLCGYVIALADRSNIQAQPLSPSPEILPSAPPTLSALDYYLHLCERGRTASSLISQEDSRTVVFGKCGETAKPAPLLRLECAPPLQPGIAVPYTGSSYEVILKTCGDTLYGIQAAGPLRAYAEAYQLAFTWENLQTVRKFSVISYLDHLKVKLLSTSGILQRIVGLTSPQTKKLSEMFKREEELAHAIHEMYTLAFRILDENTG